MHVYLRITEKCNISCKHCYSNMNAIDMSEDILAKVGKIFKNSHFIFHGGEPLTVSVELLDKALSLLEGTFSMQSNLVHLSQKHYDFLISNKDIFNNSIGTSLDFFRYEHKDNIFNNIQKLSYKNFNISTLITIDPYHDIHDYDKLIQEFLNHGGYDFKPQFLTPIKIKYTQQDIDKMIEVFEFILNKQQCYLNRDLQVCMQGIPIKLFGGNCASSVRSVNPNGKIYICPEFAGQDIFCIGDIDNTTKYSENIKSFYVRTADLSLSCDSDCFPYCGGGCASMSYWIGDFNSKDLYCKLYKKILKLV